MTIKSGTGQACAACKYQRRRCTPECLLAPFFPADQPKTFRNVHRLFGVKNIQNLLKELRPDQKAMAMMSIKFHATMRDKYPVYGCLFEIQQITYQIQLAEEELRAVLQQLAYYKQQQQQQQQQQQTLQADDYISELQLGVAPNVAVALGHEEDNNNNNNDNNFTQYNCVATLPVAPQDSYSNSGDIIDYSISYLDFKENISGANPFCQEQKQTYSNSNDNNASSVVVNPQLIIPQHLSVQQDTTQDYNERHQFLDHIDDTQSYIGSKEACESSFESPLKDSRLLLVEEMAENELKTAAACFSLTSVN